MLQRFYFMVAILFGTRHGIQISKESGKTWFQTSFKSVFPFQQYNKIKYIDVIVLHQACRLLVKSIVTNETKINWRQVNIHLLTLRFSLNEYLM